MSDEHRLIELDNLLDLRLVILQTKLALSQNDSLHEAAVVMLGQNNTRKQILNNSLEKNDIVLQKLGQVTVPEGSDKNQVLNDVGILALEFAGHHQHRLDGPHPEVVVVLLRELLTAQLVHLHHLLGEDSRVLEALRVQDNLGDELVVGHHHGNRSEQGLQVVGQLGAARVAGIHCDEGGARRDQLDLAALENEAAELGGLGVSDRDQLLGYHRQHLSHNWINRYYFIIIIFIIQ